MSVSNAHRGILGKNGDTTESHTYQLTFLSPWIRFGFANCINNLLLDLFQAFKVLHIEQPLWSASDLQELEIMDVSDADGKHLDPQTPETVPCLLYLILRLAICDQNQILGDPLRSATTLRRLKISLDVPQGQSDVGASTELPHTQDVLVDVFLCVELVEVKLVLKCAAELGDSDTH